MDEVIKLYASFEDGKLIIERQDGEPISLIARDDTSCVEVLEYGDFGHAVKALQSLLNCHGNHLDEDGIFGALTQQAVEAFQHDHGLSETGCVDYAVWTALIGGDEYEC